MSAILAPFKWFYHEFGIKSINTTGRNAWLIIIARFCRMLAYGTNALIMAIFFSALEFSDHRIGIFMTLTMVGDVFLGTFLTLVADRVGRRNVLIGGSVLMVMSGAVYAVFENYWILLVAAVFGVISISGGDFGPFRSIEESVLSQLTTPETRSDVLSWYVTTSTLGSSIGSEASGRMISYLQSREGWTDVDAYHTMFWMYSAMGLVNLALVWSLSNACELQTSSTYAPVGSNDDAGAVSADQEDDEHNTETADVPAVRKWLRKASSFIGDEMSKISAPTRSVMYKLWFLLSVDSLADGMVPYTWTNYYLDTKFHPSTSTLGDVTSVSYGLGAVCTMFAGPLARRIGLINTMVFTHVPSSAAVLFFPFPPYFWMTAALLLLRTGLNNMDQAPRTAFIAAVVRPEERTAVMGITTLFRTLAGMSGPTVTGFLASSNQFWIAFVAAGLFRLAYDFGLWALFVNMKLYEHEGKHETVGAQNRLSDEEAFELDDLPSSDDDSSDDSDVQDTPPKHSS